VGQTPARTAPAATCEVHHLGLVEYEEGWALQQDLAAQRATGEIPDTLLLLEHQPVFTTGKRNTVSNLRVSPEMLGAPLVATDRGGDITFHGPGQLVAYPIIDLSAAGLGVVSYVRNLEEVIMRTLGDYGIESGLECGLTGVWVGSDKIAAIGVRVSRPGGATGAWVTTHGLALNVDVDLTWFERIIPCGIAGRGVTSMQRLLGDAPPLPEVATRVVAHFSEVFEREMRAARRLIASSARSALV
jgi:lipoate-protein ligase B